MNYYKHKGVPTIEWLKGSFILVETKFPNIINGDLLVKYANEDIRGKSDDAFELVTRSVPSNSFNVLEVLKKRYDPKLMDPEEMVIFALNIVVDTR